MTRNRRGPLHVTIEGIVLKGTGLSSLRAEDIRTQVRSNLQRALADSAHVWNTQDVQRFTASPLILGHRPASGRIAEHVTQSILGAITAPPGGRHV